jgi:hypothetical protein
MKILNVSINKDFPPTKEVLLSLCKLVNPELTEKEIVKEIEKHELYKVAKQGKNGKKPNTSVIGDADTI